jgi:hypothetical protein
MSPMDNIRQNIKGLIKIYKFRVIWHLTSSTWGKTRKILPDILTAVGIVTVSLGSVNFMIGKCHRTDVIWFWIYWTPLLKFHKSRNDEWENDLWIITKEACVRVGILWSSRPITTCTDWGKRLKKQQSRYPAALTTSRSEYMNEWRRLENCSIRNRIGLVSIKVHSWYLWEMYF